MIHAIETFLHDLIHFSALMLETVGVLIILGTALRTALIAIKHKGKVGIMLGKGISLALVLDEGGAIIDKAVEDSLRRRQPQQEDDTPRYVYGIKGIAALFGVSERQARYIKSSGAISKAIRQQGRTIVTDATLALELFGRRHS